MTDAPVSESLAFAAFAALPVAVAIYRVDDVSRPVFVHANDECRRLAPDDPLVQTAASATGDAGVWQRIWSAADTDDAVAVPTTVDGRTQRMRLRARRFEHDGRLHLVVQFDDLEDFELREGALRSTVRQLKDLLDNSTALMYIKDLDGRYVIVNDYFTTRFGVAAEDIVGRTDHDLFPSSSADVYSQHDQTVVHTGLSIEVEEPFAGVGGTTDPDTDRRWLSIKFPLLDDDGLPYALGAISTDITDRKRAESAARQAMHEAERANQSKNEFLSRMSHELRTPLNAILGFAQLLAESRIDPDSHEAVTHILEAGEHLLALVNEVLDLTWIEAGSPGLDTSRIPAVEPIHGALEIIRPLAQANDLELASDLHGAMHRYVLADSRRLRQVFLNILGNAVKFNRDQGAIRVRCEEHDGSLRYLFTDTGPGIADDDLGRLFSPFVRLPGAAEAEGTGLGLVLSRRLAEEMGGTVDVLHTAPGEGSTFYVEVPLAPDQEQDEPSVLPAEPADAGAEGLRATILHVEDTYANVRLVESIFASMTGVTLVSTASGRDGIATAHDIGPDLVLLDLNLADMPGVEVVRALRADPRTMRTPIIVLSADATPARIAELHKAGVDEYVTKPFYVGHLLRSVRAALRR